MLARARLLQARVLPRGPLDALRQVSLFLAAYVAYRIVRGLIAGDAGEAFAHAEELIALERGMHVFIEPSVQAWASGSHVVMVIASWLYVNSQTTITVAALLYVYIRHNSRFYFVRNMFMIAMAIALVGYGLFPTAPPRFLPEWGFVDTVTNLTGVHVSHNPTLFNPYAAVPSMHVCFAVMIAYTMARLSRRKLVAALWMLYPLLMTFVIIVTANHFLIDAFLGVLTTVVSAWGASRLAAVRPNAWRFSSISPASAGAGS